MTKAVLKNRIIMPYSEAERKRLSGELTYAFGQRYPPGAKPLVENFLQVIPNRALMVPIGRMELIPENYEIIDKRTNIEIPSFPDFNPIVKGKALSLRDDQYAIVEKIDDNAIINAKPGFGKTFCALAIAANLKQKTLILCHTTLLKDQWVEEIRKCLHITPSMIGTGLFEINPYITVGLIKSCKARINDLKDEFGLLIVDEVHHLPSDVFSSVVDKINCRYKIGLSATLRRNDQREVMIYDSITSKSEYIFIPPKSGTMTPDVWVYQSGIEMPGNRADPWAKRVTMLGKDKEYINKICNLAYYLADVLKHPTLILSDRVDFLLECHKQFPNSSGLLHSNVGTTDSSYKTVILDRARRGDINKIFSTIAMFSEGISENYLSGIVLASQLKSTIVLEQLVGRINRLHEGKQQPVIVDVLLDSNTSIRQFKERCMFYQSDRMKISELENVPQRPLRNSPILDQPE